MSPAAELLRFVALTVVLIVALAVVWPAFAPRYSDLVAGGVDAYLGARSSAIRVWADEQGSLQADREWVGRHGRPRKEAAPSGVRGSWEGLLLLLALILATPRLGWRRRLALVGLGAFLMSLYYGLYVVAFFRRAFHPGAASFFWFPFSEAWVPLTLWAALTFRRWFPRPRPAAAGDRP